MRTWYCGCRKPPPLSYKMPETSCLFICCFSFACRVASCNFYRRNRNGYGIIVGDPLCMSHIALLSKMSINLFNLTPIGLFLRRHLVSGRRRLLFGEMTRLTKSVDSVSYGLASENAYDCGIGNIFCNFIWNDSWVPLDSAFTYMQTTLKDIWSDSSHKSLCYKSVSAPSA